MTDKKDDSESMHWADQTANDIINNNPDKSEYAVATGATPSGTLHVGNFREFIMGDIITKAIISNGKKAIHYHYWDDYDVFRKVPLNMPKQDVLKSYLRKPIILVPDVSCDSHDNYARHHEAEFEEYLGLVGVKPTFIRNSEQYKKCAMAEQMKKALEKTQKIKDILNNHRKEDLPDDWLPVSIYDEETHFEANEMKYPGEYELSYKDTKGKWQTFDFREKGLAKFKYRFQVPAFWDYKGIDFESAGKDHYAAGGVFDVAPDLAKELYNIKGALGFGFGWIKIKGGKQFSSSGGNIVTLKDVLEIYEPIMIRWFFTGSRPASEFAISFDLDVLKYYEDFDRCERIYYKKEDAKDEKEYNQQKRIYELSAISISDEMPFQPSIRHLTNIYQLYAGDFEKIKEHYKKELKNEKDEEKLKVRVSCVANWLSKYAPEAMKFKLQTNVCDDVKNSLSDSDKKALSILKDRLESKEYDESSLYEDFCNISKEADVKPGEFFKAAYRVILNKDRGPKLAGFIILIGKEKVIDLINQI